MALPTYTTMDYGVMISGYPTPKVEDHGILFPGQEFNFQSPPSYPLHLHPHYSPSSPSSTDSNESPSPPDTTHISYSPPHDPLSVHHDMNQTSHAHHLHAAAHDLHPRPAISNLTETIIAKAHSLPESFFPEFHQYSKDNYEHATSSRKRRRVITNGSNGSNVSNGSNPSNQMQTSPRSPSSTVVTASGEMGKIVKLETEGAYDDNEDGSVFEDGTIGGDDEGLDANGNPVNNTELRRQIHIQSEQKRRAQIKDGFEDLRKQLPGCLNKKMSKAALLHRTVQHIQHLKTTQITLLAELERVMAENEQLRNVVVQKQMGYL